MSVRTLSWRQVLYYGEAIGVLLAWVVGVLVALDSRPSRTTPSDSDRFAAVSGYNSDPATVK